MLIISACHFAIDCITPDTMPSDLHISVNLLSSCGWLSDMHSYLLRFTRLALFAYNLYILTWP